MRAERSAAGPTRRHDRRGRIALRLGTWLIAAIALLGATESAAGRTPNAAIEGGSTFAAQSGFSYQAGPSVPPHVAALTRESAPREAPNRLRAVGASLLLPGLGHRAGGHFGRARFFMMAEVAILAGIAVSELQGHARKQGYIDYAEQFAGVAGIDGKPDWYYRNLGQYRSSEDYRDEIQRTARSLYGDDLEARAAYVAENAPAPGEAWEWASDEHRREFRDRRKESRNAFRRASLFLGAALLNRLVSAVDAARLAGRDAGPRASVYYRPEEEGSGYLCLRWAFD